ncbi:hypothetical protein BCR34DRAFT_267320 [Clohesyomyces aquaticus]|uniref:Uncharacterized protein n=1 Tax=Clohesyomyces aquaticus TaxID=1231657 RepID=A0A1Y1ZT18_9PLEO|nr:hypothetical protein BCR34DRAFT_267320 [Clohesyomyces aquaticus]
MENSTQVPYEDSPSPSRAPSPTPSNSTSATAKPLPSIPHEAPTAREQPYRDEPLAFADAPNTVHVRRPRYRASTDAADLPPQYIPYTDAVPYNDDDVPLAHLLPPPTEAPPAYHVVVRQSFRDTLISHIPTNAGAFDAADEEAQFERSRPDDVRFGVERVLAKMIVAIVLLLIMLVFIWLFLFHPQAGSWQNRRLR